MAQEEKKTVTVDAEKLLKFKHDLEKTKRTIDRMLIFLMKELLETVEVDDER